MAKDGFEFGLIGSAEEIADYLTWLATGLRGGAVSLESGACALRMTPTAEVTLALKVGAKSHRGKITLAIGWRRREAPRAGDLRSRWIRSRRTLDSRPRRELVI